MRPTRLVTIACTLALAPLVLGQTPPPSSAPNAPDPAGKPPKTDPARKTDPQSARDTRIDLRPKFKPGQQIRYVMTMDSVNKAKSPQMPELDQDQTMHQEFGLVMRVVDTSPDASTVELVYESVKMKIVSDAITAEYDSTRPAGAGAGRGGKGAPPNPRSKPATQTPGKPAPKGRPPAANPNSPGASNPGAAQPSTFPGGLAEMDDNEMLATAVKGIVGTVVTLRFDGNGNITSVGGTGSLVPNANIPGVGGGLGALGGLGGGGAAGGTGGAGGAGGPWSISSPGQSGFARVGETWKNSDRLGLTPIGDFSMNTSHTLQSAAGDQAKVKVDGRIEQASAASGGTGGGGGDSYQIRNGTYRGNYVWDTNTGQLAEMNTDQSIDMDGKPMGVEMNMSTKQTVKVKRVR